MRWLLLLLVATFNALADLPTMEDPSRGQHYGFDIVVLLALAICAVGFLVVANNCIATYSEIQSGRKQWKDLGSMAGVGSILLVVIIWLLNQASDVL